MIRKYSCLQSFFFAVFVCFGAAAQQAADAPVPTDISSANAALVVSGGLSTVTGKSRLVSNILYNSIYQQMTAWGRYKLVLSLKQADIVLSISVQSEVTDVTNGSSVGTTYVQLELHDPKTNVLLWRLDEPIKGAFREKTFRKNVDTAVAALIDDLKRLVSGQQPDAN